MAEDDRQPIRLACEEKIIYAHEWGGFGSGSGYVILSVIPHVVHMPRYGTSSPLSPILKTPWMVLCTDHHVTPPTPQ